MPDDRTRLLRRLFLTGAILSGLLACVAALRDVGPQGWWAERGPVIPHESFPADCTLCHEGGDWHTIREDFEFDHEAETGVALVGAHARAECLRCHNDRGPVAAFARRGCAGCHEDVHRGQLGKDCAACHGEERWAPRAEILDHARTRFPLIGAHAAAACWRCHPGAEVGEFTRADPQCLACHAGDLARAQEPDHLALGWTDDCQQCHLPTTWTGMGFHHSSFALTGAHALADCQACHAGGVFAGLPRDCFACHSDEYAAAKDPDHLAFQFPTDCEQCHDTSGWEGARFDHRGIRSGCVDCHLGDWQDADDPDHQALDLPLACEQCHDTLAWENAVFDHTGIRAGCVECHLVDWQQTTDPNHAAAGFPTSCELCHDTFDWASGQFDHAFPIQSGDHAGFDCSDCHTSPRNFLLFSCIDCHAHRKSEMDDEHDDVRGYVWQSSACYACHPDGQE